MTNLKIVSPGHVNTFGHQIAREWAGRNYNAADLSLGREIAARDCVVTPSAKPRVVFGRKVS